MKDKYSEDVARTLDKIANNESNKFTNYINTNKSTEAFDVAISVLSLVEQRRCLNGPGVSQLILCCFRRVLKRFFL